MHNTVNKYKCFFCGYLTSYINTPPEAQDHTYLLFLFCLVIFPSNAYFFWSRYLLSTCKMSQICVVRLALSAAKRWAASKAVGLEVGASNARTVESQHNNIIDFFSFKNTGAQGGGGGMASPIILVCEPRPSCVVRKWGEGGRQPGGDN